MALIMDNNNYPLQFVNWLHKISFDILCLIGSSLSGYDAFSFAESVSQEIMKSERKFWSIVGMERLNKTIVVFSKPKPGYYDLIIDYIVQLSSDRHYSRSIYNGFTSERLMSVMSCCGTVLNCLLIEGFDSSLQDLDVFWLDGSWKSFLNEINNFKQMAHARILTEKNYYGKLIEFQFYIDQDHIVKI
ncbi:unnamed protein product, partial [Rotaria sp. Silwood1]